MRVKFSFLALHVFLPTLAGGIIYICWRDPGLLMFKWFGAVGLGPAVNELRLAATAIEPSLPRWLLYCLPDGLWVYAFTAFMGHVWRGSSATFPAIFWISLGFVIGAGSELGQWAGFVPGAFDRVDFFFSVFAAALALFFTVTNSKQKGVFNEATV